MKVIKLIRVTIVFLASAIATFALSVELSTWIFVYVMPHSDKVDDGNGGAIFVIVGVFAGLVTGPTTGALTALGVETLIARVQSRGRP